MKEWKRISYQNSKEDIWNDLHDITTYQHLPQSGYAMCVVTQKTRKSDTFILIFGGVSYNCTYLNDMWLLDTSFLMHKNLSGYTDEKESCHQMWYNIKKEGSYWPKARSHHSIDRIGSKLFLLGGEFNKFQVINL